MALVAGPWMISIQSLRKKRQISGNRTVPTSSRPRSHARKRTKGSKTTEEQVLSIRRTLDLTYNQGGRENTTGGARRRRAS